MIARFRRRSPLTRLVAAVILLAAVLVLGGITAAIVPGAHASSTRAAEKSADLNGDGVVDNADVSILQSYYGQAAATPGAQRADLNDDGVVNITDLSILLSHFGPVSTSTPTTPTPTGTTASGSTSTTATPVNVDINRDGVVDNRDLDILKSFFGQPLTTPDAHNADLNGDGVVNIVDLSIFLSHVPPGTTFPPTTSATPTAPSPPIAKAFAETESVRSGVRTFANYHNASGLGPLIGYRQVVQVSCKVQDGTIKSVNPDGYWYRIASPPWNDAYYAPANTFLNGDPPNGPYSRNTDFSVPNCGGSVAPGPSSSPVAPTTTTNKSLPPPSSAGNNHLWITTLGDSYTAGNGAGANYDGCHRSYNSYAWLYMNRLRDTSHNADIWQEACSGNVTTDVPDQIADLAKNTPVKHSADIVVMTIGGNDLHFSDIVYDCLFNRGAAVGGCSSRLDHALNAMDSVILRTKGLLQIAAQQEPHAQIILIGYPLLTSPSCPHTKWNGILQEAQGTFDLDQRTMVKQLVQSSGSSRYHFVSVAQLFSGRGPCAAAPTQYVRGVEATIHSWMSYHPNAAGNQAIANLLYETGVQNW